METLAGLAKDVVRTHGWLLGFIVVPVILVCAAVAADALYERLSQIRRRWA